MSVKHKTKTFQKTYTFVSPSVCAGRTLYYDMYEGYSYHWIAWTPDWWTDDVDWASLCWRYVTSPCGHHGGQRYGRHARRSWRRALTPWLRHCSHCGFWLEICPQSGINKYIPKCLHGNIINAILKDLVTFCNTKHNVHRFTLNLHRLKIMIVESVP